MVVVAFGVVEVVAGAVVVDVDDVAGAVVDVEDVDDGDDVDVEDVVDGGEGVDVEDVVGEVDEVAASSPSSRSSLVPSGPPHPASTNTPTVNAENNPRMRLEDRPTRPSMVPRCSGWTVANGIASACSSRVVVMTANKDVPGSLAPYTWEPRCACRDKAFPYAKPALDEGGTVGRPAGAIGCFAADVSSQRLERLVMLGQPSVEGALAHAEPAGDL